MPPNEAQPSDELATTASLSRQRVTYKSMRFNNKRRG